MRLSRCAAALVALCLFLPGASFAAGKKVISNYPVTATATGVRLPVAIADATIIYPLVKWLPPARVASVAINVASTAIVTGAAYLALQDAMNTSGGGPVTYNNTTNVFENTLTVADWDTTLCGPNPRRSSNITADLQACLLGVNPNYRNFSWTCTATDAYGCRTYSLSFENPGCCWNSGGVGRPSGVIVSQSSTPLTDQQIYDMIDNYAGSKNIKDIFRQDLAAPEGSPFGAPTRAIDSAAHQPLPLTPTQQQELNDVLQGIGTSVDALVNELADFAKQHGIDAAPDPNTVPDATQEDGATDSQTINVNVTVPTDTPGGAFDPATLETLDSFQSITQTFVDGIEAAPIVSAWTGIASSVPAGSCPNATLTVFGDAYQIMTFPCQIWEDVVAPLLSLVFLFVWPFIGMRIVMSS